MKLDFIGFQVCFVLTLGKEKCNMVEKYAVIIYVYFDAFNMFNHDLTELMQYEIQHTIVQGEPFTNF